ncbi:MAG: carboxypeptidase regulatory-like domain-containing protein, partial [Planctomycetes bacterium]|nr:carboxypeptidase regulatory-like domain-containing protein [Planctomycetota bacterium]
MIRARRALCATLLLGTTSAALGAQVEFVVVDSAGKPVEGVEIALAESLEVDHWFRADGPPTDATGRTAIEVPDFLANARRLIARPRILAYDLPEVAFDPSATSTPEPFRFVLPPTGSVRIYARDQDGEDVEVMGTRLRVVDPERDRPLGKAPEPILDGNSATIRFVGLGLGPLRATVHVRRSLDAHYLRLAGPKREREMVVANCEGAGPSCEITMRVLGLDGEPLRNERLFCVFASPGAMRHSVTEVATDESGRLRTAVSNRNRFADFWLVRRLNDQVSRYLGSYHRPELRVAQRLEDLGSVRLEPDRVLVAGRVVDPHGRPISGVMIRCDDTGYSPARSPIAPSARTEPESPLQHYVESDEAGAFVMRETSGELGRLVLTAYHPDFATRDPRIVVDGRREDLSIEMFPSCDLEFSFANLPDGVEDWTGTVRVLPERDADDAPWRSATVVEDHVWRVEDLPSGRHVLAFYVPGSVNPDHEVPIEVDAEGELTAPIEPVDWSEFSTYYAFRVVDAEERVLTDAKASQWQVTAKSNELGVEALQPDDGGRFATFVSPKRTRISISHPRFRLRDLAPPFAESDVVLEPRVTRAVRITNLP